VDRQVSLDASPVYLWADAICINQEDTSERASQIQLMRCTYSLAKVVLAWLGDNDYTDVFNAIEILAFEISRCRLSVQEELGSFGLMWELEQLLYADSGRRSPASAIRKAIMDFFNHPYWSWV
jgi:hypothetical protein